MRLQPKPKPRRWNVEVDGIRWLPRLIDKARMRESGTLGAYLLGQSPVDRACLERLGMSTEAFAALACRCSNDEAVLSALRTRGFDEARVRRWSERFPTQYQAYIPVWDVDEGYRTPTAIEKPLLALLRVVEEPLMGIVRKVIKAP